MDTKFKPQNTQNTPKCLTAGPTIPVGFNDKNKTLTKNDANGSGGSAVVIASRGAKDVMRKLVTMEKSLQKNKNINYSSTDNLKA